MAKSMLKRLANGSMVYSGTMQWMPGGALAEQPGISPGQCILAAEQCCDGEDSQWFYSIVNADSTNRDDPMSIDDKRGEPLAMFDSEGNQVDAGDFWSRVAWYSILNISLPELTPAAVDAAR
jgi:hypothetical protein